MIPIGPDAAREALQRLSRAIQIPTVSAQNYEDTDFAPFDDFLRFLETSFPLFHKTCESERVNRYGLVYRWPGTDAALPPLLLMAHYDVVPAGDPGAWTHGPFSGEIAEGRVWGRGTLDIKSQLTAHMEAAEALMLQGFRPGRDVYFAYGQDEETGNDMGATAIAALFKERGLRFEGVLDEGGIVVSGGMKGVKRPLALIGVAEKGRTDFEIAVDGAGGHSAMPPETTALGRVAELVTRIERNPLPARLTAPVLAMLSSVADELGGTARFAIRHARLFGGLLKKTLAKSPEMNAMLRTTFAVTMARGSQAANVLPRSASVTVNVRLLDGDTVDSVTRHFIKLAGDIPISIRTPLRTEASPVSPAGGAFYDRLTAVTRALFPEAIVTPYLVTGGTDARKYAPVCANIYRFTPLSVTNAEQKTVHNIDESISVDNYTRMITFFTDLLKGWQ